MKLNTSSIAYKIEAEYLSKKQKKAAERWGIVPEKRYHFKVKFNGVCSEDPYPVVGSTILCIPANIIMVVTDIDDNVIIAVTIQPVQEIMEINELIIISNSVQEK